MRIIYRQPEKVHSLSFLNEKEDETPLCDKLENIQTVSEETLRSFILRFICQFFRRESESVKHTDSLIDMEVQHFSLWEGTLPIAAVAYGPQNGGLPLNGSLIFCMIFSLDEALGIKQGDEPVLFAKEINDAVTVGQFIDAYAHVLVANGVLKG
jgi:hypothetical protein